MLLIYSQKLTNRLSYTLNLVFNEILGINFSITTDKNEFLDSQLPKINYSLEHFRDEIFISADILLFENTVKDLFPSCVVWKNFTVPFATTSNSFLPFDLLAATFFLVSRYEEYTIFKMDKFHRFPAHQSWAYKHHQLKTPLVNAWCELFAEELQKIFPKLFENRKKRSFLHIPTIDIDNAFAYKHKGFLRNAGSTVKNFFTLRWYENYRRFLSLTGISKDDYDNYDFIEKVNKKYHLKPIYFVLFANYGKQDKNLSPQNPYFQRLIKNLSANSEIGIHPSFKSNQNSSLLETEKKLLEKVIEKPILKSRQHFLKLQFPYTYKNLLKLGIKEDYSMGFASETGFRASICIPFKFFDLIADSITDLTIFPFPAMDRTLHDYKQYSLEKSAEKMKDLVEKIRKYNGVFVSLWHNETLSNLREWKNWRELYELSFQL